MSGTRSLFPMAQVTNESTAVDHGPSPEAAANGSTASQAFPSRTFVRLIAILYPFVAAAIAVNLFMLSLIAQAFDLQSLAPVTAILLAAPLGVPAAWITARWVRSLIEQAERTPSSE